MNFMKFFYTAKYFLFLLKWYFRKDYLILSIVKMISPLVPTLGLLFFSSVLGFKIISSSLICLWLSNEDLSDEVNNLYWESELSFFIEAAI